MTHHWPQNGYNIQYGPTPSRVYGDVDAVIATAHERQYWCQAEKGMTVRIIIGVGMGCYVGFNVEPDGTHAFHEANGCGWVWRGKQELAAFLDFLRGSPTGTTKPEQQPGFMHPILPATSP